MSRQWALQKHYFPLCRTTSIEDWEACRNVLSAFERGIRFDLFWGSTVDDLLRLGDYSTRVQERSWEKSGSVHVDFHAEHATREVCGVQWLQGPGTLQRSNHTGFV